jgi:hypothetical protein
MKATITLAQALGQARDALNRQLPPANLLAQVQAALPATPPAPRRGVRRWASATALALPGLAAIGCLVWALQLTPPPQSQGHPLRAQAPDGLGGFVPVAAAQSWPQDSTPAWLVNTELRRDRLALLGLPFDPGRAGDSVRAELLVRASGEVLAVRLLP